MLFNDLFLLASDIGLGITLLRCYPDKSDTKPDNKEKNRTKKQVEDVRTSLGRSGLVRWKGN